MASPSAEAAIAQHAVGEFDAEIQEARLDRFRVLHVAEGRVSMPDLGLDRLEALGGGRVLVPEILHVPLEVNLDGEPALGQEFAGNSFWATFGYQGTV